MLHVVAIITTQPGKRSEVLDKFRANVPNVLAEAGCIEYGPTIDSDVPGLATFGPDTFVVIEVGSAARWQPHEGAAHGRLCGGARASSRRSITLWYPRCRRQRVSAAAAQDCKCWRAIMSGSQQAISAKTPGSTNVRLAGRSVPLWAVCPPLDTSSATGRQPKGF
jgi:quinol monooxygenase YgiN